MFEFLNIIPVAMQAQVRLEPLQGKTFLSFTKADHGALQTLSGYFHSEISNGMAYVLTQKRK